MTTELIVYPSSEALARAAAERLCDRAISTPGRVAIALSGGSTPKRLYQLLVSAELAERFPWDRVHWFWGDERFVPPDSPDSNFAMVKEAMLDHVSIPPQNIHPIPTTDTTPEEAARRYEHELRAFHAEHPNGTDRPLFDVVLLGLGEDGHTASLFPAGPLLDEREHWVGADGNSRPEPRISLTYPALESAREVIFLVSGAGKRAMLNALIAGEDYPAAHVEPRGTRVIMADAAAAPAGTAA